MKLHIASTIFLGLVTSSCFKVSLTTTGKLDGTSSGTTYASSTALGDDKEIASIDADSKESTQLTTPKTSGLSGASVVIAPGSLGISVGIVVEQASDFSETSIATEMGLADDIQVASASSGMIVRPSENVDLKKPLSLAMPLPTSFGFRLANTASKYAIFYKYFDPKEQKLVTGFKVVDGVSVKMVFDEKSRKDVIQFEGYFGAYWAAVLNREVAVADVPAAKVAEEPIINKAKVAVYNSTGVVKETEVVAKQAVPELVWDKPTIKFVASTRMVSASVAPPKNAKVSGCKVDFFEAANLPKGISFEVPLGTSAEYNVVKATEHNLVARFRCTDEESRITITPWSNLVVIPAIAPVATDFATEFSSEVCASAGPNLYAQGYNEYGQFSTFETFAQTAKCKYRALINVENSGNFYLTNGASTAVCGLASHTLALGAQKITCQKGSIANVGSNHMTIPSGNYIVDVDFSSSVTQPTMTLALQPCDRGDFYLLFSSSNTSPTFPTISEDSKMKHKGGCEYVYEKTTLPISADGAMQIRNAAGTYSCGSLVNWGPNQAMYDHCGTGALRYDLFSKPEVAQSYRVTLAMGDAAKKRTGNYAQESFVEYRVQSSCPEQLFMLSTASGLVPDYQKNGAYRQGACRYEFPISVDSSDLTVYNYKIANAAGAILCGGSSSGGNITLNCNSSAPAVNFEGTFGKTVKLSISGNGITGQLNNAVIAESSLYCDGGLYLQSDYANGMKFTKAKAFQEISECLYEKNWTPSFAGEGFYLASGNGNDICGNYNNSTNQPSLNGASAALFCNSVQYASNLAQIITPNLQVGTTYKIRVDKRRAQSGNSIVTVSSVGTQNSACDEDLYMIGSSPLSDVKNADSRMTKEGNCNYSFTLNTNETYSGTMNYSIRSDSEMFSCYRGDSDPVVNMQYASRSALINCASNSETLSLPYNPNSVYRFNFKRDPTGVRNELTVQNLSFYGNAPKIAGLAAAIIGANDRSFQFSLNGGPNFNYIWSRTSASNFVLDRNGYGYEFCGLESGSSVILGNPMSLTCRYGTAAAAPVLGNWPAGSYILEYKSAKSVEDNATLKVSPYNGFSFLPLAAATGPNATPNRAPYGTLAVDDPTFTPGGLDSAVTWTDSLGRLWAYGGGRFNGDTSSALWRYIPNTGKWTLMDGSLAANEMPQTGGSPRPGAKRLANGWFDTTNNRLYLYGGFGKGLNSGVGEMNDLWYYQLTTDDLTNAWHFVKGDLNVNAPGYYGTVNVAAATNYPPPRSGATAWMDLSGKMWLFGGRSGSGFYNDTWRFTPGSGVDSAAGNWTWVGGAEESINHAGSGTYPSARSDSKVGVYQGLAYLFGGTDAYSGTNDMWIADCTSTCNWNKMRANVANTSNMNIVRKAVFSPSNQPTVYGGAINWVNPTNGDFWLYMESTFWVYRPSLNQWAAFPALDTNGNLMPYYPPSLAPYAMDGSFNVLNKIGLRQGALLWTIGSRVFIYGGYGYDSNGYGATWSDLWEIQTPSN